MGSLTADGLKAGRRKARAEWRMMFLNLLEDEGWPTFLPVTLTVDIPDDLAAELGAGFQNLGRAALEALAAEAYSKEVLSLEQIRRMLGLFFAFVENGIPLEPESGGIDHRGQACSYARKRVGSERFSFMILVRQHRQPNQ